jgi:hypothetical protein
MRYYKIEIDNVTAAQTTTPSTPTPGQVFVNKAPPTTSTSVASWTSNVNGTNDPGALDIEFDIQFSEGQQQNSNYVKIKGITPQLISQSSNLNKKTMKMWAGFSEGLPLANLQVPHQGLLYQGIIYPVFGNWIYNELSLDMILQGGPPLGIGGPTNPKNIIHNMPKGTPLSTAIQNTLQAAFPQMTINMAISDSLKLNYNDYGFYQSIEQFGNYIKALSHSILGTPPTYEGVKISVRGNNVDVYDGTKQSNSIAIQYNDLVGQPTWLGDRMQVTTCLRGDIRLGSMVTLPKTNVVQTINGAVSLGAANIASEYGAGMNFLNFSGTWKVAGIRHIGKFRSTQMDAWISIFDCASPGGSGGATAPDPNAQPDGAPNQSGSQTFKQTGEGSGFGSST